jgi:hypothetical protein
MLLSPVPLKKVQFYSENFRGQKEIKKQKQDINNMQNCSIATQKKKKKKKEGKEKKKERKKRVNPSAKTDLCI